VLDPKLKAKINKLWNAFWAGGLANPLTAIEQISYLIFMKRLDDLDTHNANAARARGQSYKSVFEGKDNCRWSNWKHMNAESMYKHVTEIAFPFIKNLHNGEDVLYSKYMKDATFMIPKPALLQEAVALLDEINIGERPDIQGDIYEHLLGELKTAGKNGQFRTPRHIIRMMVELIDPDIGQRICDPACGTGGFLIAAYQHILRKYTTPEMVKIDEDGTPHNLIGDKIVKKEHWDILWNESFYGVDFDITMIRVALMNMILHGISKPNILHTDSLSKSFDQKPRYDVVFANPPFAGYVDRADISDNFKIDTTKTELLFLELFYNLLNIGGKAAVIVPSGVLFGASNAHVKARQTILENSDLQAVISMPTGVFKPYSGVSTAVLLFVKGGKTEKVWFHDMKSDGYTLDDKREFIDGKGDIPSIISRFKEGRVESEQSVLVPFDVIRKNDYNLSISKYKQIKREQPEFEEPGALIERLTLLENEILNGLKELRAVFGD
jgi:type I restriction enzyme M protein